MKKIIILAIVGVLLVLFAIGYFRFFWPFAEGVKAGTLNTITHKGYIWKTYEGKLIQEGYKTQNAGIQSNQFDFSVADKRIADSLMRCTNKIVELHYIEYKNSVPWRGFSECVVDSIISVRD